MYSQAVAQGDGILADWLLVHGADPNRQNDLLSALLVLPTYPKSFHMEKSLIKYGASLNETDTLCWVTSSNDESAKLLEMMQYLDVGVNFNHM